MDMRSGAIWCQRIQPTTVGSSGAVDHSCLREPPESSGLAALDMPRTWTVALCIAVIAVVGSNGKDFRMRAARGFDVLMR